MSMAMSLRLFFRPFFVATHTIATAKMFHITEKKMKHVEMISKIIEIIIIMTVIVLELLISVNINEYVDIKEQFQFDNFLKKYTNDIIRRTIAISLLAMYLIRLTFKSIKLFLSNSISHAELIRYLEKERNMGVLLGCSLFSFAFSGLLIHGFDDERLKKLYYLEVVAGVITMIGTYWNSRCDIMDNEVEENQQHLDAQELEEHQQQSDVQEQQADVQEQQSDLQEQQSDVQEQVKILHFYQPNGLQGCQIIASSSAINVRPHILFCIVRNIDLATHGNLEKFFDFQNELYDEVCQKRTLATIGTHDLSLISRVLIYDARDPNEIHLIPLGKGPELVSARDFYDQLCKDTERERKLNERYQFSDIHKYLSLLQNQNVFPCLSDQYGSVISIPPLTTAERSKLSLLTESILIEITSAYSMDICYRLMDLILRGILRLKLTQKLNDSNLQQCLILQQTRVVDEEGQLKLTFPSRTDLDWNDISYETIVIDKLTSDK